MKSKILPLLFFFTLSLLSFRAQSDASESRFFGQFSLVENTYLEKTEKATYSGGENALSQDIYDNGKYIESKLTSVGYYLVPVCIKVSSNGTINNIQITSKVSPHILERAKKLLMDLPEWKPGVAKNGKLQESTICFTINYIVSIDEEIRLKDEESHFIPPPDVTVPSIVDPVEMALVEFPDVEAAFTGGVEALKKWMQENINYPDESIKRADQGKVYVAFKVQVDGSVTDVTIERGVTVELDTEAKRMVRSMPKWIPGQKDDKNVVTRVRLPISFVLPEDK